MNTEQSYVGRETYASQLPPTDQISPRTALNTAQLTPLFLSDWYAVEELLKGAVRQNPTCTPNGTAFDSTDPSVNLEQAKADLLSVLDSFTEGSDPAPHLLELVQVWTLSEGGDLAHRENQRTLRLILNLVQFLTELRGAYNNYAYFLEQSELAGGAEHGC